MNETKRQRIGIFGGTFDPVHLGHLILAETVRDQCDLDEIHFIPAKRPPHKQDSDISPDKLRVKMLEFALAGHGKFKINLMEIKRDGLSFTVDTLRHLREAQPEVEHSLLIGADSLHDFPNWREPAQILELANVIAVNRAHAVPDLEPIRSALGVEAAERIQIIDMPMIDISSTDLRARIASKRSIRFLTPRPVELFIQENRLYQ